MPIEWIPIGVLLATNIFTLWWALLKRIPATEESIAILRAIHIFERNGGTLLKIERVDPESIFLRSPSRMMQ